MIAVILGTVIVTQIVSLVGNNGSLTGKILVWVMLRELAPLLTALVVISRSGTAIAAELGTMKISGEIDSIEMMGIPAGRYLILPRITGVTTSIVILTVYFVLSSFIGSFVIASIGWHIPYDQFIQGVLSSLGLKEVLVLFIKSILFGLFISAICCRYGLRVGRSATEIPQAATRAVMSSSVYNISSGWPDYLFLVVDRFLKQFYFFACSRLANKIYLGYCSRVVPAVKITHSGGNNAA